LREIGEFLFAPNPVLLLLGGENLTVDELERSGGGSDGRAVNSISLANTAKGKSPPRHIYHFCECDRGAGHAQTNRSVITHSDRCVQEFAHAVIITLRCMYLRPLTQHEAWIRGAWCKHAAEDVHWAGLRLPLIDHMSITAVKLRGRCACGAVEYSSDAPPAHLDFCYCQTCQQVSGAPFAAWMGIPKAALHWQGNLKEFTVSPIAIRTCCATCGSTLTIDYHCYPHKRHIAAGTVVEGHESVPSVGMHIFVDQQPPWYVIPEDRIPRWAAFDPEFEDVQRQFEAMKKH
jgi:hypothetical protein